VELAGPYCFGGKVFQSHFEHFHVIKLALRLTPALETLVKRINVDSFDVFEHY